MKLAVCIPCVNGHRRLLLDTLKFIEAQTRKPDIVVVSISKYIPDPRIDISGSPLSITVIHTTKDLHAGANRNIAAAEAVKQGATHISFFDADDIMHPQRLECIERAFTENSELVGFLHCFLCAYAKDMNIYTGCTTIPWEPITNDFMPNVFEPGEYGFDIVKFQYCFARKQKGYGMGANGHITVLADFWQKNPYLETIGMGEDSHFSCSILKQSKMLGYTGDILSVYMRHDVRNFQIGL
jgi:hypothetical protein